jgi:hypothetical protein
MPDALELLLAEHRDAVQHFTTRARAIPTDRWLVPRAEGKWTPAEETRHIILTYEACVADLRDERRMQPRTRGLQRLIWRAIGLTSILYRRRIPRGVRAPREVRPPQEQGSREELLAALDRAVADFERVYADTWKHRPGKTLAHPFFGAISLRQTMAVAVVHTRHHAAFLPANGAV